MPITKTAAVARAKTAAATRKRNERSGKPAKRRSPARKATRRRSRGRGMGQLVTPAAVRGATAASGNAALGGLAASLLSRIVLSKTKMNPIGQDLVVAAVGFGLAAIGKRPMSGAGMVGYATGRVTDRFLTQAGLSDNAGYLAQNNNFAMQVESMPKVLDAQGNPMEDNNMDYLQENGDMYLADDGNWYQVDREIAPDFSNPFNN